MSNRASFIVAVLSAIYLTGFHARASECYQSNNLSGYTNFLQERNTVKDSIPEAIKVRILDNIARVTIANQFAGEFKEVGNGFYILTGTPIKQPEKITTIEILTVNKNLKKISLVKSMNGVISYNYNTKSNDDHSDNQMLSGDYYSCNEVFK